MVDATVCLSSTQSPHLLELYHGHDALWNVVRNIKTRMCDDTPPIFIISVQLGLEEATTIKLSGSDP